MKNVAKKLYGSERVRFLLVGGINTVVGYGVFVLLELTIGAWVPYLGNLYLAHLAASMLAFHLHRTITFSVSVRGGIILSFIRFQGVYVVALLINTAALPLLVEVANWQPLVAQGFITVATTIVSYFGHKYFSFHRGFSRNE